MIRERNRITLECDIAVVGGGPAGIAAAVSAARRGKKVILVEQNAYLGGALATGLSPLSFLDKKGRPCIGGFAQEFIDRLVENGWSWGTEICPKHNSATCINSEGVKLQAFRMCKEAGVQVLLHCQVLKAETEDNVLKSVIFLGKCNEITVRARIYIDCTGDGDLAYLAGCSYEKGQIGSGVLQPPTVMFTLENVDQERFFDYIAEHPGELRYNDSRIYENPAYDIQHFRQHRSHVFVGLQETFARHRAAGTLPVERTSFIYINGTNPGEVYVNSIRMINTDATDIMDLSRAEMEGALQIPALVKLLKKEVPGFENCFVSAIAPSLGVRETRRFRGLRRVTETDALNGIVPPDTICLCGYKIDIHSGKDNGLFFRDIEDVFGIPFGALVSAEVSNLMFAGRCISSDAVAFGALRVIPCCMAMGHAAAVGAGLSLDRHVPLREADVSEIRRRLSEEHAVLSMRETK